MNPITQCNNCANRSCHKDVFRNPLICKLPCQKHIPPSPFKARLLYCAFEHDLQQYGVIRTVAGLDRKNYPPQVSRGQK